MDEMNTMRPVTLTIFTVLARVCFWTDAVIASWFIQTFATIFAWIRFTFIDVNFTMRPWNWQYIRKKANTLLNTCKSRFVSSPLYPGMHSHSNVSPKVTHLVPLKHGEGSHKLTCKIVKFPTSFVPWTRNKRAHWKIFIPVLSSQNQCISCRNDSHTLHCSCLCSSHHFCKG